MVCQPHASCLPCRVVNWGCMWNVLILGILLSSGVEGWMADRGWFLHPFFRLVLPLPNAALGSLILGVLSVCFVPVPVGFLMARAVWLFLCFLHAFFLLLTAWEIILKVSCHWSTSLLIFVVLFCRSLPVRSHGLQQEHCPYPLETKPYVPCSKRGTGGMVIPPVSLLLGMIITL